MVGTRLMAVMRWEAKLFKNKDGSNAGRMTVRPPLNQKGNTNTPLACMSEAA